MSHTTGLRCRECGTETPIAPLHVCETCFGPLEVQYDYAAIRRTLTRELDREPAAQSLALSRAAPDRGRAAHRPALGLHPARARRSPRRRARRPRAVGEGRLGQPPHLLLQGSRRLGGDLEGHRVRLRHRVVRLDREPRQLRVRTCGARGSQLLHLHSRRPRAGQGDRLHDLRSARGRDPRQLRRRESAVQRDRRQVRLGLRQHQHAPVLHRGREDLRVRDRRAARLAAARSTSWCRSPAARSCRRSRRRSASCAISAWSTARSEIYGAQAGGSRAGDPGAAQGHRPDHPGEAADDRQVDRHRQPGRRLLRAEGDPRVGRLGRVGDRRGDRRRASSCWRAPRASSPSRPAAPRWRSRASWSHRAASRATSRS